MRLLGRGSREVANEVLLEFQIADAWRALRQARLRRPVRTWDRFQVLMLANKAGADLGNKEAVGQLLRRGLLDWDESDAALLGELEHWSNLAEKWLEAFSAHF